tara:strand:- start:17 stop:178 length:162 start_codon:yes stop_codon:yes gene_type:complete
MGDWSRELGGWDSIQDPYTLGFLAMLALAAANCLLLIAWFFALPLFPLTSNGL